MLVTQKSIFEIDHYESVDGHQLTGIKVGFETFGELNDSKDNAILVCHYFSGNSHCAGRYSTKDEIPGYWDSFIGPQKSIDTNKYFVISIDTLANINVNDGITVTTGPATVNPKTNQAYGSLFPILRVDDWVNIQKQVIDSLEIPSLRAVVGPSGGSIQAAVWAVNYPDMVNRLIMAISPGLYMPPWCIALLKCWVAPIKQDSNWNNGDYYDSESPLEGLKNTIELIQVMGMGFGNLESINGQRWANSKIDPANTLSDEFEVEQFLSKQAEMKASIYDANHLLYTAKAYQQYDIRPKLNKMKAKVLLLPASTDMIFPPALSYKAKAEMESCGVNVQLHEIIGDGGHYDGLTEISQHQEIVTGFITA